MATVTCSHGNRQLNLVMSLPKASHDLYRKWISTHNISNNLRSLPIVSRGNHIGANLTGCVRETTGQEKCDFMTKSRTWHYQTSVDQFNSCYIRVYAVNCVLYCTPLWLLWLFAKAPSECSIDNSHSFCLICKRGDLRGYSDPFQCGTVRQSFVWY